MTKKRTLIYPFDQQFLPVILCPSFPADIDLKYAVSPKGWGLNGKDIGEIEGGEKFGIQISSDFASALKDCVAVIFSSSDNHIDLDSYVIPKVYEAASEGKEIYCCVKISQTEYDDILKICDHSNAKFHYYGNNSLIEHQYPIENFKHATYLHKIDTPIIMCAGLTEYSGKFKTQLGLASYARSLGYKASLISSRGYSELIQEHPIPSFMFDNNFNESEKIISFNHYIKYIEDTESPDLIIVGIPGGILPLDPNAPSWFGVTAYEITRAVSPDAGILTLYYDENYSQAQLEEIAAIAKYRFALDVNAFVMSNIVFDFIDTIPRKTILSSDIPEKLLTCENKNIHLFSHTKIKDAYEHIFDCLNNYAEVEQF